MSAADLAVIGVLLLLLGAAGLFSAAEISLLFLGSRRARRIREGLIGRVLDSMIAHPGATLGTILMAITAINYVAEAITAEWVITRLRLPVWTAVVGVAGLVLIFSEMVPIFYAAANPERVARALALPVWLAIWALYVPARVIGSVADRLVRLLGGAPQPHSPVTEGEIRAIVDLQAEAGGLEAEEKVMIHSIFEFGDKVAREVMVPRTNMIAAPDTATVWEAAQLTTEHRISRLPLYHGDLDHIVGLVHVKDLLPLLAAGEREAAASSAMKAPYRIPESRKLDDLLDDLRRERRTAAIVIDEYGGTAGLVTMEDLLEEVVGDIWDEYDVVRPMVERTPDGAWEMDGRINIDEASEALEVELPEGEYDSLAGLLSDRLGMDPRAGDRVELEEVALIVQELDGYRIARVRAELLPRSANDGERNRRGNHRRED
jgi:CBS domain containing-hemolysin-like protein